MDDHYKVKFASMYMEGKVARWYRFYCHQRGSISWDQFQVDVCRRFAANEVEIVVANFYQIKQLGTTT